MTPSWAAPLAVNGPRIVGCHAGLEITLSVTLSVRAGCRDDGNLIIAFIVLRVDTLEQIERG